MEQTRASLAGTPIPQLSDVLLVTASESEAQTWRRCLVDWGWQGHCDVLTQPSEICRQCHLRTYHAILLDQSHPGLTPKLTAEILRRLGGHPPVILVTDAPSETDALEGLASGAFDYVFRSCLGRLPLATLRAVEATDLKVDLAGADDHLREAEHRFQALAECLTEGVAIEGPDGILLANPALGQMLAASGPLDLLGHSLLSCVAHPHRQPLAETLLQQRPEGESVSQDIALQRFDGTQLEARLTAMPVGFHGQTCHLFVVQDRREQRRTEAVINNLATFAQENPSPILLFSADGRITYYNNAAMEMAQSLGREHPSACLPPQAQSLVESCLLTGNRRLNVTWEQAGRTYTWSFFPHRSMPVVHAFGVDITDQRQLEDQLRHSQRLEGVGRLAGGVAHEYSNLLTVIEGQARLMARMPGMAPEGRAALQQMLHATDRAKHLNDQLQAFSRRNQAKLVPVDLGTVLGKMAGLLRRTLGENIELSLELGSGVPGILADPSLLEQLILNLAVNARDAMPDGGQLILATATTRIEPGQNDRHPEARPGRFVRLTVADNGCGIDPRILPYVFEPFFTTKNPDGTSGLGLSTSHGIVKQHKGWIEVDSQRAVGTRFRIHLPAAPDWAVGDEEAGSSQPNPLVAASETVLVVEDDTAVRFTLRSMLEQEGYRVIEAANPLEALSLWRDRQSEITVLLTDLVMPSGISGQELAQHLKDSKPGLDVIYASGYCIESLARGRHLVTGVNFLQKPFSGPEFTETLRHQRQEHGAG